MVGRIAALSAALAAVAQAVPQVVDARTAPVVKIDLGTTYQQFDGTGISEAFERGRIIRGLDGLTQKQTNLVLDLLFSNVTGAGMTILRNGLGSSPSEPYDHMESIAPFTPPTNSSPLNYVSLASLRGDNSQIWLSKEFMARGGKLIYADAWSADGYMKNNSMDTNGGYLCGVTNATCASGDWRQSYANKIAKYLQDYEHNGIHVDFVGFLNEPDLATPYASMQSNGQQAADFIEVLAPTLKRAGLTTQIACCDGSGWNQNRDRITGIQAAGAEDLLGLVTSHGYSNAPNTPFNTTKKTWITEWSTFDPFNTNWYTATGGSNTQSDGLTWANHIQSGFGTSNISAFVYWWGATNDTDNQALIWIPKTDLYVSKRLWALAHWGRLVAPGAHRTSATVTNFGGSVLNATSFANPDGSVAIQIINNGANATTISLKGAMNSKSASVTSWLTDNNNNFTANVVTGITGGMISAELPPMSLTSFYISQTKGARQLAEEVA